MGSYWLACITSPKGWLAECAVLRELGVGRLRKERNSGKGKRKCAVLEQTAGIVGCVFGCACAGQVVPIVHATSGKKNVGRMVDVCSRQIHHFL